jgi:hypothetical protein
MSKNLVDVRATIPEHRIADFYRCVTDLNADAFEVPDADLTTDLTLQDVHNAYWGGTENQPWRDLLLELSTHPDQEVYWPDLCETVGQSRRVMSGVIGAGERRTKDKRPYTKRYQGDDTWFLMTAPVAKLIQAVATSSKPASS